MNSIQIQYYVYIYMRSVYCHMLIYRNMMDNIYIYVYAYIVLDCIISYYIILY